MIEKINKKLEKEIIKILDKEELTFEDVQILSMYRNDLKFEEKMKRMAEFNM